MRRLDNKGYSLTMVLVGALLGGLVLAAAISLLILTNKVSSSFSTGSDQEQVRLHILGSLDCERTLNPANATYTIAPPACAAPPMVLRNGRGQKIAPHDGTNHLLHGWTLTVDCNANELRVRVTKPKGGAFEIDPVLKLPFDLNHPRATIFSGPTGLCQPLFKASSSGSNTSLYHVRVETPCSGVGALPYHYYSTTEVNSTGPICFIDRNDNAFCREISGVPGNTYNKHICRPSLRHYIDNPVSPWNYNSFTTWSSCTKVSGTSIPGWDWGRYSCQDKTVSTLVGKLK